MLAQMETTVAPQSVDADTQMARRFLDALGRRDFEELESLFAPDVWFRALLPRKLYELTSGRDAVDTLRSWFGGASDLQVLASDHHKLANRQYILYRFLLRPDWAPEQWHVIEQVGFFRIEDGRIRRLDLVCTGFFPAEELERGA